jgi:hypothetical protein
MTKSVPVSQPSYLMPEDYRLLASRLAQKVAPLIDLPPA